MKAIYIHIPFCNSICTYGDFCKLYYDKKFINDYLNSLNNEIRMNYNGEKVSTIYIGGGTPSTLDIEELKYLFKIIEIIDKSELVEYTIECNIEDLKFEKLKLFKENGINRLSIGVQSFNDKIIKILGRNHNKKMVIDMIGEAKRIGFNNINIDLIYGIYGQTLDDLNNDIKEFIKLDIPHVSFYSLIIEPHTKLYIDSFKEIDEDLNIQMYERINQVLKDNKYIHYEISNYAKEGYESKHNLVIGNNEHNYGFGLGASSYVYNVRYDNTRNIKAYINQNYVADKNILTKLETMQNEMILGLRLKNGINKDLFYKKYNKRVADIFDIDKLLQDGHLIDKNNFLYIPEDKWFVSNSILLHFID